MLFLERIMLKAGDKITITDGSYAFGIKDGEYIESLRHRNGEQFTVVQVSLTVARRSHVDWEELGHKGTIADILITDNYDGFWFMSSQRAKLISPTHTLSFDGGNTIEISDESFQALKKQFS